MINGYISVGFGFRVFFNPDFRIGLVSCAEFGVPGRLSLASGT